MSMLVIEKIENTLWLSGNVMPSEEKRLQEELSNYVKQTPKESRVVEMSGVKYISSSAAKALLTIAQEANFKGGKLKVRSSIPVVRTLSLLGAETWCEIEPCREPNRKPSVTSTSATAAIALNRSGSRIGPAVTPQKGESNSALTPAEPSAARHESSARIASAETSDIPPTLDDMEVKEALGERRSTVGLNAPGTSVVRRPTAPTGSEASLAAGAAAKAGLPLVNQDVELPDDLAALKNLIVMKTYTFQLPGLKSDITGKVLARIGGPWILIDTHGAKKMLNIKQVSIIDILA